MKEYSCKMIKASNLVGLEAIVINIYISMYGYTMFACIIDVNTTRLLCSSCTNGPERLRGSQRVLLKPVAATCQNIPPEVTHLRLGG